MSEKLPSRTAPKVPPPSTLWNSPAVVATSTICLPVVGSRDGEGSTLRRSLPRSPLPKNRVSQCAPESLVWSSPINAPDILPRLLRAPTVANSVLPLLSRGSNAIELIDIDGRSSVNGLQDRDELVALVVFQIPPFVEPM